MLLLRSVFLPGLTFAAAAMARAQDSVAVGVGARVRVTDVGASSAHLGIVTRFAGDTIWVLSHGSPVSRAHPLTDVRLLERSAGRGIDRRVALTGAVVGAVVGGIGGDLSRKRVCPGSESPCGPTHVQATLTGAALGALAGALPAVLVPRERWKISLSRTDAGSVTRRTAPRRRFALPEVTFHAGIGRLAPMDNVFDDTFGQYDGPDFRSGPARRAQVAVRVLPSLSITGGLMTASSVWTARCAGEGGCNQFWSDTVELSYRDVGARATLWRWNRGLARELWLGGSIGQVTQHVRGPSYYRLEWFTDRNTAYGLALGGSVRLWRALLLTAEVDDRIARMTPVHFDWYEPRYSHSIVYSAGIAASVF